jgi:hypothetical protein
MIEVAKTYYSLGFSVVPVKSTKLPIGKWKENQTTLIEPSDNFVGAWGIAMICGKVSGGLECLDLDLKYDTTGKLFAEYKQLIEDTCPGLLKKMVVQSTMSGGYHFLYRCEEVAGNQKLASRLSTDEEKALNPKEKAKVLLETRGEGGFFVVTPSPGYSLIYGNFENICKISKEEREVLLSCARSFNQVFDEVKPVIKKQEPLPAGEITPLDDYNLRGDGLSTLQEHGWVVKQQRGPKSLLLRPGGTGMWSADYDSERKCLYVFSSSTEFEPSKAYSNSAILAHLKYNKDYSATAKALYAEGYGTRMEKKAEVKQVSDPNDLSFLASHEEMDAYIQTVRDGTFKMGLSTGMPALDNHFRFKEATLLMICGHDNTGKSSIVWYLDVIAAMYHGWKFGIASAENKIGGIKRKLMEFYLGIRIESMTNDQVIRASEFVKKHFFIVKNDDLYDHKQIINMARVLRDTHGIDNFLIDPYNALAREADNYHEMDYKILSEIKLFITKSGCGFTINSHAVTNALRREYPKGHKYEGFPMPPGKADVEGGGKSANKADDFLTIHRLIQHPHEWMYTDIHVRKIKEMESGGKPTILDEPVRLALLPGSCSFESVVDSCNPVARFWAGEHKKPIVKSTPVIKPWTEPVEPIEEF